MADEPMAEWKVPRAYRRFERRLPVRLARAADEDQSIDGVTENLSAGGAFVVLPDVPFAAHERLSFEIFSADQATPLIVGDAEVRWTSAGESGQGCGLRFVFTSPQRHKLERLLHRD